MLSISAPNWNCWSNIFKKRTDKNRYGKKRTDDQKEDSIIVDPKVRIVYRDNFKNSFQMTMFFLAYVVTFLGELQFTRNYFFTVNISAGQLLLNGN